MEIWSLLSPFGCGECDQRDPRAAFEGTDHFTSVSDSFLGHICSNVSWSIDHCERIPERMDRCTDDFKLVCPDTSLDGLNLCMCYEYKPYGGADVATHFLNILRVDQHCSSFVSQNYSRCDVLR